MSATTVQKPEAAATEGGAAEIAKAIGGLSEGLKANTEGTAKVNERLDAIQKDFDELKKTRYTHGAPNSFNVRTGENIMSSRPYSLMRLAKAVSDRKRGHRSDEAKIELDLSERLQKAHYNQAGWEGFSGSSIICPLGADLMPADDRQLENGEVQKGLGSDLVNECRQVMNLGGGVDLAEAAYILRRCGMADVAKDLSSTTLTAGGALVGLAATGELIDMLRAVEFFSQVGASQIDMPTQGRMRFPRLTGSVTVAATSEGATLSESTPSTGELNLLAKAYSGFTDIPEELLKFATSVAVEVWLRSEFVRALGLKADRDMLDGVGGTSIKGIVNYANIRVVIASTTGASGDTLDPEDPVRLLADIADQNAPTDRGFFYGMTNTLWGGLTTRKDSAGQFVFSHGTQMVGGGRSAKVLNGERVITSTQIPTNRVKTATDLTLLLGGVGAEWVIARAGVVEIDVTNSDGTKFQTRTSTLRGTQYLDAGPRHEQSFGMIDDLVNA